MGDVSSSDEEKVDAKDRAGVELGVVVRDLAIASICDTAVR